MTGAFLAGCLQTYSVLFKIPRLLGMICNMFPYMSPRFNDLPPTSLVSVHPPWCFCLWPALVYSVPDLRLVWSWFGCLAAAGAMPCRSYPMAKIPHRRSSRDRTRTWWSRASSHCRSESFEILALGILSISKTKNIRTQWGPIPIIVESLVHLPRLVGFRSH